MKKIYYLVAFLIGFTYSLSAQDYNQKIENYFKSNLKDLKLTDGDIDQYIITDQYDSKNVGLTHIYVNQTVNGVKIFNAIANFTIKNGEVIYMAPSLQSNINARVNTTTPAITAAEAILFASQELKLKTEKTPQLIGEISNTKYIFEGGTISEDKIPVELYLKPQEDGTIKLVWEVNINNFKSGKWWNVYVNATDGAILSKHNIVLSCFNSKELQVQDSHDHATTTDFSLEKTTGMLTGDGSYNIFPIPVKHPEDGVRSLVTNPADATASPYGWHDTNGVAGAESTLTQGNNVKANADTAGDNTIGFQPDGGATLDFNFLLDLTQQPNNYISAATTNLFYINNMMHDVWYHYGFDEAAGNFQSNNYGNGGSAGDYVIADAQDGGGTNNANFATPPDGSSPRMQMYLWNYPFILKRLQVNSPTTIADDYAGTKPGEQSTDNANPLFYNISGYSFTWKTGDLILADDGSTAVAQDGIGLANIEGCGDYINPSNYSGKIVLIKRGVCTFAEKLRKANAAGAAAAIIYQRDILPSETSGTDYFSYLTMSGDASAAPSINSIFIGKDDAALLIAKLENNETVNVTLKEPEAPKDRDGSLETDIISHEYAHGISTRLTGGPSNSTCLSSVEQMGEGWSDWAAFMMTLSASSTATEELNLGDYVLWGIQLREAPYTTDMTVNGYTYAYTNQVGGEVHSIGFVWSSILWDLTWKYIDQYGYDADLINGTGGNNKIMDLVMLAMKLQPCNPDFITGRDAILDADQQLTGGVNKCMIWEAFARRGVGVNATSGGNENFDLPSPMPTGCVLAVEEQTSNTDFVKIYPNPSKGVFNISALRNINNASIQVVDINGRVVYSAKRTIQGTSSIDLSNLKTGVYIINIKGDNFIKTAKLIKN